MATHVKYENLPTYKETSDLVLILSCVYSTGKTNKWSDKLEERSIYYNKLNWTYARVISVVKLYYNVGVK